MTTRKEHKLDLSTVGCRVREETRRFIVRLEARNSNDKDGNGVGRTCFLELTPMDAERLAESLMAYAKRAQIYNRERLGFNVIGTPAGAPIYVQAEIEMSRRHTERIGE